MGTSFQPAHAGQANSDVTYSCSRPYNWQNERLVIVDAPSRLPIDDVPAFAAVLWAAHDAPLPYRGFRGGDCSDSDM